MMLDQQKDWTFKLFLHNFFKENNLKNTLTSFESEVLQTPNFNQELPIKSNRTFLLEMWNIFFHLYGEQVLKDFAQKNSSNFSEDLIGSISFSSLFKTNLQNKNQNFNLMNNMDLNSMLTSNPLILSTLENFKNFSRTLGQMNPLGNLNLGNLSNMSYSYASQNTAQTPNNYELVTPQQQFNNYQNPSTVNNYQGGNDNSETSSISLGSEKALPVINPNGGSKKIFNTSNSGRSSNKEKDSFMKKRKRYIKNNKFVYVHPGSMAAKKLEMEKALEDKNKEDFLKVEENEENLSDFNMNNSENCSEHSNKAGKKPRGSRYRGVSRNGNQWQVLIMVSKKKRYVGSYSNEEDAARAYDKVALQNHGTKAKTNFDYLDEEVKRILLEPPLLKIHF